MTQSSEHVDDELLSALADDQLIPHETDQVRAHLATCSACQSRLDEFRTLRSLLRQMPEVELPRDFRLGPRLVVDPPNVVRLRRWYTVARTATASLAAIWVGLSVGALYVGSRAPVSGTAVVAVQPQNASAPAPSTALQNPDRTASEVPRLAVPAAAPKAAQPAPPAAAGAAAVAREPAASPQPDDQVAAATTVSPLPTPPPTPQPTALPPLLPVAPTVGTADPAAPLRTAAVAVAALTVLAGLAMLLARRQLKQTASHF